MNKLPEEAAFSPQGVISGFEEAAMNKDDVAGLVELKKLQKDAGTPHLPTQLTYQLRRAVAGYGTLAYQWADKPHRLVYDACREIEAQADALTNLSSADTLATNEINALKDALADAESRIALLEHDAQYPMDWP